MITESHLVWVNKTQDSSSLSNCRSEKHTLRQIRNRAVTLGHKSSRVRRPIKRTPLDLSWIRRDAQSAGDSSQQPSNPKRGDNDDLPCLELSASEKCTPFSSFSEALDSPPESTSITVFSPSLSIYLGGGSFDPFDSYAIELNPTTLNHLSYFQNIWTQSAFKLPGCIGYGQTSIPQREITSLLQQCLESKTRSCCLLAASSARMRYIHHPAALIGISHRYAASALKGLQRRMQESEVWKEEDATDVLFLAAYEIYCDDKVGAEKHLAAVRKLYKREIGNTFVRRLQANLEILVAKARSLEAVRESRGSI